jgi:hypothetical protein
MPCGCKERREKIAKYTKLAAERAKSLFERTKKTAQNAVNTNSKG